MEEQKIKRCCAAFYGSDLARILLGDSFHPGGTQLTHRLGILLRLTPRSDVLDVASGRGTSAFHLAESFGCHVVGIDLSEENVRLATAEASQRGLAEQVQFQLGDAEGLRFAANTFNAIVCECAFCIFSNKQLAAGEFLRVLKPGGRLGLSDLTSTVEAIPELEGLLARIACIGDAAPKNRYIEILMDAGFQLDAIEDHNSALGEMARQIQGRLLGAEIMVGMNKLDLPGVDFAAGKEFAQIALEAIRKRKLGYVLITAGKA